MRSMDIGMGGASGDKGKFRGTGVATVEISHEMGLLTAGGRELVGWKQAAPEQSLLVLPIQEDGFHDELLEGAHERGDFGGLTALQGTEPMPVSAMLPKPPEGVVQTGQEVAARLVEFERGRGIRLAQLLVFPSDDPEQFLAGRQVCPEISGHLTAIAHAYREAELAAFAWALVSANRSTWLCQCKTSLRHWAISETVLRPGTASEVKSFRRSPIFP